MFLFSGCEQCGCGPLKQPSIIKPGKQMRKRRRWIRGVEVENPAFIRQGFRVRVARCRRSVRFEPSRLAHYIFHLRQKSFLEWRREGNRRIERGDAYDGPVEIVEATLVDDGG